jgi:hypothetical protein
LALNVPGQAKVADGVPITAAARLRSEHTEGRLARDADERVAINKRAVKAAELAEALVRKRWTVTRCDECNQAGRGVISGFYLSRCGGENIGFVSIERVYCTISI